MKWDWATLLLCAVWMREEGAGETFLLKMNYFEFSFRENEISAVKVCMATAGNLGSRFILK